MHMILIFHAPRIGILVFHNSALRGCKFNKSLKKFLLLQRYVCKENTLCLLILSIDPLPSYKQNESIHEHGFVRLVLMQSSSRNSSSNSNSNSSNNFEDEQLSLITWPRSSTVALFSDRPKPRPYCHAFQCHASYFAIFKKNLFFFKGSRRPKSISLSLLSSQDKSFLNLVILYQATARVLAKVVGYQTTDAKNMSLNPWRTFYTKIWHKFGFSLVAQVLMCINIEIKNLLMLATKKGDSARLKFNPSGFYQ